MRALPWVSKHQKTVTDQASQLRESLESLTQHLRAEPLDAWLAHVEKRTKVAKSATLNQEWAKRRSELVARRGPAVRKAAGKKGYEEAYARLRSDVRRLEGFLSGLDDEKQLPRDIPAVAKSSPPKARRLAVAEQIAKDNGTGALEAVREQTLAAGLKHVSWGSDGLPALSAAEFQRQAQWQALCGRYGEGREDGGMLLLAVLETTSPKPEARLAAWRKLGGLNDWPLSPEELKAELALHAPIVRLCNELKATDAAKSGKLRAELDRETHRRWELAFNSLSAQAGPDLLADKAVAAALALSKTVPIRTEKLQAATRLRIHIYEFRQEVRRRRDEANKQWLPKAIGSLRAKLEALPKEFQGTPGVGKLVQALKGLQDADLAAPGLRQRLKEKGWLPELSLDKVLAERDLSRLGEGAAKYSEAVLGLAAAEPRVPKPDDPVEEEMAAIDALLERGNARAAVERIWKTLVEKWKTHRRTGWAELRAWVAQRESKHAALRRIGRHRLRSLDRQLKEYMEQEAGWQKTLKELEGTQDLREKIRKLETYVRWNYNSVYLADANKLLTKLRDELARRRPGRP